MEDKTRDDINVSATILYTKSDCFLKFCNEIADARANCIVASLCIKDGKTLDAS